MNSNQATLHHVSEPPQPDESTWRFVQDLQSPLWTRHSWYPRNAANNEASLAGGLALDIDFPDPKEVLATAYDDLKAFAKAGGIGTDRGYPIRIRHQPADLAEQFRIEVEPTRCTLTAGDTEGIRRGIFHIEDMMLRAGGPFLPLGVVERSPVIRTRISRCFFGPINRPPKKRDELADDINYYPDDYLNRLAHDGVNGLWLTIKFRDLCRSDIFPQFGLDSQRRLEKLRQTVKRCGRYGIKIFPFCIEPAGFGGSEYLTPKSAAAGHPELFGHTGSHHVNLCTSTDTGKRYLEEATFNLFSAVPELGGLIAIQLGERPTHCYSEIDQLFHNNCPRCSKRHPGEVFAEVWSAMARGMRRINPAAELISWLYTPQIESTPASTAEQKMTMIREIAAHAPPDVTLQVNFESGGMAKQFGRQHPIDDYSLSFIGPSDSFAGCAGEVRKHGGRMGAKLQVANSHEVATTAYVPVPGHLYRKYAKLHELNVSSVMQCWFFGNYPSPMTKAAGELSFAPLPATEDEFLERLASLYWPGQSADVVKAWGHFHDAYGQFPAVLNFSWFGPVHDSVVWPLHLIPVDQPISPSWLLGWPASGDRVGECVGYELTMDECRELCRNMSDSWQQGVAILQKLAPKDQTCVDQLNVARAMGMQLASTSRLLEFYSLRNQLPHESASVQKRVLEQLKQLAADEIIVSRQLADLAETDSRLGFHSEAEGYKYFPQKLRWRAALLEKMIATEFPKVEADIQAGRALFGAYTGQTPKGLVFQCPRIHPPQSGKNIHWGDTPIMICKGTAESNGWTTQWQAVENGRDIHLKIRCRSPEHNLPVVDKANPFWGSEHLRVLIESRRLGPSHVFQVNPAGPSQYSGRRSGSQTPWEVIISTDTTADGQPEWIAQFRIPWACLGGEWTDRVRVNIQRVLPGRFVQAWAGHNPLRQRLIFGEDNPADYGWWIRQPG